jgi:hypothetical protein
MRLTLLAIAAASALVIAAVPISASAQPWGHHWGGHFGHFGFGGPAISFGFGAPYSSYGYDYDYDYGPGCYRVHRVWTPWGWRLRRAWVC